MRLSKARGIALIGLALAALTGCGDDDDGARPPDAGTPPADSGGDGNSIADIAASNPEFSMLVAAATRAGLVETLSAGEFTVFAPTNAAFEASGITMAMIESMPVDDLTGILTYHALAGTVESSDVMAGPATSVSGSSLILGTNGGVTVNGGNTVRGGANVTMADIEADNGVIHVIDRVLLPPTVADLVRYAGLTTLASALQAQGLTDDLAGEGPFTLFAPTNEAFTALGTLPEGDALTNVLLNHVLSGSVRSSAVPARASALATNPYGDNLTLLFDTSDGVVIDGGPEVVVADVIATNGVMHVVDAVIVPMNVLDAARAAGLTELLDAVGAAADLPDGTSLAEALAAQAPYTVFAPTNAAFEAISDTLATLTPEQLRDVLLFHVLDPAVFETPVLSSDLPASATDLATLNPTAEIPFVPGPPPTVDGAGIAVPDIVVTNGVVHVIDAVMLP